MFSTTLQHCLHFLLERRKSWPFLSSHKQHCVTFKLPEGSKKQATFNFGFGEGELKAPRLFFPNKDLWSFDVNISKIMPLTVAFKSMQVYTLMEISFKATYLCFVFFIIYKWILNQKQIVQLNKRCSCKVVDLQRVLSGTQGLTHFMSLLACKTVTLFLKTSFPSNAPEPHT